MTNGNPYRDRGYTAVLNATENGDFVQIRRGDTLICEVAMSVWPDGPNAEARIQITRFVPGELRDVRTVDDFG